MNFEEKVCEQIPSLRRYARSLCGNEIEAEDLVQDCLERALRKRHLWRTRGGIRPWLFRLLYNLFLNHLSSARVRRESTAADAGWELKVDAAQESQLECRDAVQAVQGLPPDQRAALMLMVLEAPSYQEAAKILGINVGTLRSRLSRAREAVRRQCESDVEAEPAPGPLLRRVK
ncbi:sigma-70 family RNA polymerase sigma factor [Microbulbifer litoralis]|uniref:sigma-70 family RNA polymerase sigma factor n=1 Tax=Microbulbifer litoralis TaxID=2933965 RepID=UPI002027C5F7|nr:sigma-70 family RNA polymerase sigma factor [Microbulbifer sp. GX H0434]